MLLLVGDRPLFESRQLLRGRESPSDVHRQLSRWVRAKKLYQLRRGLYALAPPFQKRIPHPFHVAHRLVEPSYVSCETALVHHGLTRRAPPAITSVTTERPGARETQFGVFGYRFMTPNLWGGFDELNLGSGMSCRMATAEKAVLDWVHLEPGGDEPSVLAKLGLEEVDRLSPDVLYDIAEKSGKPKLMRAVRVLVGELPARDTRREDAWFL